MAVEHSPHPCNVLCNSEHPLLPPPPPPGWLRKLIPRIGRGLTKKKLEVVYVAPDGDEIKSKTQLQRYLKMHPGGPAISEFNWSSAETARRSSRLASKRTTENSNLDAIRKRSRQCFAEISKERNEDQNGLHSEKHRMREDTETWKVKNSDVIEKAMEEGTFVKEETMQGAGHKDGFPNHGIAMESEAKKIAPDFSNALHDEEEKNMQEDEVKGDVYMSAVADVGEGLEGASREVEVEETMADMKDAESEALIEIAVARAESFWNAEIESVADYEALIESVAEIENLFQTKEGIIETKGKEAAVAISPAEETTVHVAEAMHNDVHEDSVDNIDELCIKDLEAKGNQGECADEQGVAEYRPSMEKVKKVRGEAVEMENCVSAMTDEKARNRSEPEQEEEISKETDIGEPRGPVYCESIPVILNLNDVCEIKSHAQLDNKTLQSSHEKIVIEDNCLQHHENIFCTGMSIAQDKIISHGDFCAPASVGVTY